MVTRALFFAAITVALTFAALTAAGGSSATSAPAIQGDADCDGSVSTGDALAILSNEAGFAESCATARGDIDCNGATDNADVLAVLRYLFFTLPAAPAGGCPRIGEEIATPTVLHGSVTPSVTSTPLLSPTPTVTPGSECGTIDDNEAEPEGAPVGTPRAGHYKLEKLPADADLAKITNVVPVPGDDDLALITGESGLIWAVCLHSDRPREEALNITAFTRDTNEGHESDEGLVGLAFDPIDPSYVYINYSTPHDGEYLQEGATPAPDTIRSRISRFHIENGRINRQTEEVIIDVYQPFEWQNANQIAFGPDGMLYIASGAGGLDRYKGQTLDDLWGAILRIDVHSAHPYAIPAGNPFTDGPGGNADEVWAYGFRNPWRFDWDDSDRLWVGDVGAVTWEELNIVSPGANYGWPIMEGDSCFTPPDEPTPTPGPPCDQSGLATPRVTYNHNDGCAVIGGQTYHGSRMPELDGYFIYDDFCFGKVWAINTHDDNAEPILLADTDLNIVDWAEDAQGELVAVGYNDYLFHGDTGLYELVPSD
jgi:glucose/arabinose dehydrogenase